MVTLANSLEILRPRGLLVKLALVNNNNSSSKQATTATWILCNNSKQPSNSSHRREQLTSNTPSILKHSNSIIHNR